MSLKEDAVVLGIGAVVVVGLLWYAKNKVGAFIPSAVKEGAEAFGVLTYNLADTVLHPLNGFGIEAGTFKDGTPKFETTAPWDNANDVVSNGAGGMNFNLF